MQRKARFALTMIVVFLLLSPLIGTVTAAPAPQTKWTVMVYMSGDNNLEDYIVKDLELELAPTGSSANVQIVALADRGPGYDTSRGDWQSTKLYHVTQGLIADSASALADWGERDMGDKQTLIDFVTYAKTNYPAAHYALYFWGHGWNWHPDYVMSDDTSGNTLDLDELKAALPTLGFIDVVGYDGCNMASIEVDLAWHGYATAVSSSQEYVGWNGIEYDVVLAQLAANPNMSADQVAIATSQSASSDKTWSAIAVDNRFTALMTAVNEWSTALNNGLAKNRKQYDRAFGATQSFWQAPMDKDLYDMAYEINRLVGDTTIKAKSKAVMTAVNAVVLNEHHVNAYGGAHGITIYHISTAAGKDSDYTYYRTLDFALQTSWDEFLNIYAK